MRFLVLISLKDNPTQTHSTMGVTCEWEQVIPKVIRYKNRDYETGFSDFKPDWDEIILTIIPATDEQFGRGVSTLLGTAEDDQS